MPPRSKRRPAARQGVTREASQPTAAPGKKWRMRTAWRYTYRAFIIFLVLCFLPALWRHWITYPRLETERKRLAGQRRMPPELRSLHDFRGVLHAHSEFSHDSRGTLPQILAAARQADLDFIFLTDHPENTVETFPRGHNGRPQNIIIASGAESHRLLVLPAEQTTIDWGLSTGDIIRHVVSHRGAVFFAHSEEEHDWRDVNFQGMEIYNIHTDFKDENQLGLLLNMLVNAGRFRHWVMSEIFDPQLAILARWDSLNLQRRVVGIAGNDAHNNINISAQPLPDGRLRWFGPNAAPLGVTPGWGWLKALLHADGPGRDLYLWQLDPYAESFEFVTTHILSDTLSAEALRRHLVAGHVFVAFDHLADSRGFQFAARQAAGPVLGIMGDSVRAAGAELYVQSPLPARIAFLRNGKVLHTSDPIATACLPVVEAGVYRAALSLRLGGTWRPWIYSNPIYLTP